MMCALLYFFLLVFIDRRSKEHKNEIKIIRHAQATEKRYEWRERHTNDQINKKTTTIDNEREETFINLIILQCV